MFEKVSLAVSKPRISKASRLQQKVQTHLKVSFSDNSDLEDSVETGLIEKSKSWDPTSGNQTRKSLGLKTDAEAAPGSGPGYSGLSIRNQRAKKLASGHCEELSLKIMRTFPVEKLTTR